MDMEEVKIDAGYIFEDVVSYIDEGVLDINNIGVYEIANCGLEQTDDVEYDEAVIDEVFDMLTKKYGVKF